MDYAKNINGATEQSETIAHVLSSYKNEHPNAEIDVRQRSSVSNRIRIIDADFEGIDWVERESVIWKLLDELPDDVYVNITMLLLLTPDEAQESLANQEFENPVPMLM